ncbi:MAG: hypothetical protein AB7G75_34740 [Candidatus Binatia bacterium]
MDIVRNLEHCLSQARKDQDILAVILFKDRPGSATTDPHRNSLSYACPLLCPHAATSPIFFSALGRAEGQMILGQYLDVAIGCLPAD